MIYYFFTIVHSKRRAHSFSIINDIKTNNIAQAGSILIILTSP
jgi:hypothetical protein